MFKIWQSVEIFIVGGYHKRWWGINPLGGVDNSLIRLFSNYAHVRSTLFHVNRRKVPFQLRIETGMRGFTSSGDDRRLRTLN